MGAPPYFARYKRNRETPPFLLLTLDGGQDIFDGRPLVLIRADGNPGYFSVPADDKRGRAGNVVCVHSDAVINPVGSGHASGFIKQDGKWVVMLIDVFLAAKKAFNLLGSDDDQTSAPFRKLIIG